MSASLDCATEVHAAIDQELDAGTLNVPLLPQVASEVLGSTLDDRSNAQRLADLIEKDQGLASHIMRVVNSPGFRGSSDIVSLKQAIARLGMERIREIALTISLKGTLFKPGPYDDVLQDAWSFGLCTALWSKEVARQARKNVEIAYLCGLLHNVGIPIMVNRVVELAPQSSRTEVVQLSADLAPKAGAVLIDKWHLPAVVATCITSLSADAALPQQSSDLDAVRVVQASRLIASQQGEDEIDTAPLVADAAFQHLNFYPDDVAELLERRDVVQTTIEGMQ